MNKWWRVTRRVVMLLIPLGMVAGWLYERRQYHLRRPALEILATQQRAELDAIQRRLYQEMSFDGFHSAADIYQAITETDSDSFFLYQSLAFIEVDDAVFDEGVPVLMQLLADRSPRIRSRAWDVLKVAREDRRFRQYQRGYIAEIVKLMRQRSEVKRTTDHLNWLVREQVRDESIRKALRQKMRDDFDPCTPQAAFALAELYPEEDIVPRLIELIEMKHQKWTEIVMRIPNYVPAEEARRLQQKYGRARR